MGAGLHPDLLEQGNFLTRAPVFMLFVLICDRAQDVGAGQIVKAGRLQGLLDIEQLLRLNDCDDHFHWFDPSSRCHQSVTKIWKPA